MDILLLLFIPLFFLLGWYLGLREVKKPKKPPGRSLSKEYFVGLNYLLNEQQDKAVDVFIKMLEVDSNTVETHLALGSLFRRRGEVDRAIRIHQNLIARPQLSKSEKIHSLLELGQDYMKAGVLDRAERLFIEVVESGEKVENSLQFLLDIYEQEKDWLKAISTGKRLQTVSGKNIAPIIAHYYCELAEKAREASSLEKARSYLKRALSTDKYCLRASLVFGAIEYQSCSYRAALRHYQRAIAQDADYISEVIEPLRNCYIKLSDQIGYLTYLQHCLGKNPRITLAISIADLLRNIESDESADAFVVKHLVSYPSVRGLKYLIGLQLLSATGQAKENLTILQSIMFNLLKDKPIYQCNHCGYAGEALYWQCPGCKKWSTIKPIHGLEGD